MKTKKSAKTGKTGKYVEKKTSNPTSGKGGKAKGKKSKKVKLETVITPIGRFSFPHLAAPDDRAEYGDGKYKVDLLVSKKDWDKSDAAKELKAAVIRCAKANGLGSDLRTFKNPFKDTDKIEGIDKRTKGCVLIRAKSENEPFIFGPTKNEDGEFESLSEKEIKAIKGGDWGRLKVAVGYYPQQGGGVTLYLNAVQFKQAGEPFGDGKSASVEGFDEMEVEMDDLEESDEEEETEDDDEDTEESDDEETDDESGDDDDGSESDEDEDEESEEDEEEVEEDEEEEEKPKKKSSKGKSKEYTF